MNKVLAYCGLDCGGCGAYLATKNNDDANGQKRRRNGPNNTGMS